MVRIVTAGRQVPGSDFEYYRPAVAAGLIRYTFGEEQHQVITHVVPVRDFLKDCDV